MEIRAAPTNYGVVLFPGFQALDVFGPLDVLNMLSKTTPLKLSIIAETLDPVSTLLDTAPGVTMGQSVVPTHTFENPPADIDVLIVPGGKGTRHIEMTEPIVSFLQRVYPRIEYLFTVCTGSALAARAGLLDGLRATSNKRSFTWVTKQRTTVDWVLEARWVVSKNIWTSSGISAGIDMMYAFVSDKYGEDVAADIAIASEYVRNTEADNDPFAKYAG